MNQTHILLVEDNPAEVALVEMALRTVAPHLQLIHCADGDSFLHHLQEERLDELACVLLDLNMPGLSGQQVLGQLRHNLHWRQLPVVVFTTSTHQRDVSMCYELGANAYVEKPLTLEAYETTLRRITEFWTGVNVRGNW